MSRANAALALLNLLLLGAVIALAWERVAPEPPPAVERWLEAGAPGEGTPVR